MIYKKFKILFLMMVLTLACSTSNSLFSGNTNSGDSENESINSTINNSSSINNPTENEKVGPEQIDLTDSTLYFVSESVNANFGMAMNFEGENDEGEKIIGSMKMQGQISHALPGISLEIRVGGEFAFDGITYIAMTDLPGASYFYTEDIGCILVDGDSFDNPFNEFMQNSDFQGTAKLVERNVEVEGFITDKYLIKIINLPEEYDTNEFIELYDSYMFVDQEYGAMIRLELNWLGTNEALSGSTAIIGDNTAIYDYFPAGDDLVISPPAECNDSGEGGQGDSSFPIMDDASEISSMGDMFLEYKTEYTLEEILAFYKNEFESTGYTGGDNQSFPAGAMVTYTLGDETINIIVTQVGNTNLFTVILGKE